MLFYQKRISSSSLGEVSRNSFSMQRESDATRVSSSAPVKRGFTAPSNIHIGHFNEDDAELLNIDMIEALNRYPSQMPSKERPPI